MAKNISYRAGGSTYPKKKTVGRKRKYKEGVRHINGKRFTRVTGSPFNYRKTAEKIAKKEKKSGAKATRIIKTKRKGSTYYNVFSYN